MRPLAHIDLTDAARALLAQPAPHRPDLCARMIREADWADRYRRRLGRLHDLWGDGTLSAAARQRQRAPERRLSDRDYCTCLEMVLHAVLTHQRRA
ncbi:MAG: hypothetical protein AAGF60_00170 [Pseudomonadota bacterium]